MFGMHSFISHGSIHMHLRSMLYFNEAINYIAPIINETINDKGQPLLQFVPQYCISINIISQTIHFLMRDIRHLKSV